MGFSFCLLTVTQCGPCRWLQGKGVQYGLEAFLLVSNLSPQGFPTHDLGMYFESDSSLSLDGTAGTPVQITRLPLFLGPLSISNCCLSFWCLRDELLVVPSSPVHSGGLLLSSVSIIL